MSVVQFLRILWARKWVIMGATVSCLIGALIVAMILPPRWEAHSRVMLDLVKPDPVTGQVIQTASTRAYVATQFGAIPVYQQETLALILAVNQQPAPAEALFFQRQPTVDSAAGEALVPPS